MMKIILCLLAIDSLYGFIKKVYQFDKAVEEEQYEELWDIKLCGSLYFLFFLIFIGLI